jgi:hypothetical protein
VLIIEILSHIVALMTFLVEFRKPVMKESGEQTLDIKRVYRNYKKNGMIFDVIAFLPTNLLGLFINHKSIYF